MAQKFYHEPEELPGGFFEALQPLANWALAGMREVYRRRSCVSGFAFAFISRAPLPSGVLSFGACIV